MRDIVDIILDNYIINNNLRLPTTENLCTDKKIPRKFCKYHGRFHNE